MTRIIDVDRLIFHSCPDMKGDCPYWGSGNCGVCQKAIITRAEIDNAPTVETGHYLTNCQNCQSDYSRGYDDGYKEGYKAERPHGKWEEPFEMNGKSYHKCTNCHISSELILIDKYCPECGAKMDEEADNDKTN